MRLTPARSRGFALIEVLVTILVLLVGLLGMFRLLSRSTVMEMESYQRSQAMALTRDMEARMRSNFPLFDASFQANYAKPDAPVVFGQGSTACDGARAGALKVVCAWSDGLQGQSEREGSTTGAMRGAMVGARGCLIAINPPQSMATAEFFIVVVWQGLAMSGSLQPNTPGAICARNVDYGPGQRRAIVLRVLIPHLGA